MMVHHQLVIGVASEPHHERRFPCFFDISLIPLAVLIIVGQLKKAPPRLLNNPSYQKEREQVRKHLRILDVLGVGFALALMIIQWGNPALSLAFQAFVIWGVPSQLYRLWQKFNVPRGVLFACAVALIVIEFGLALLP